MKTLMLAATVAMAALFGAAPEARAGDIGSSAGNLQGEALQMFITPLTNSGVTQFQISALLNTSASVLISSTIPIYSIEVSIVRDTATSTTGWALFSWSGSLTGGMTSAAGANGAWNHQHFTKFGIEGNETVGADDELIRFRPYREGFDNLPIRRAGPVIVYIGTGPAGTGTGDVIQVRIRFRTQPYGVNPSLRQRRGSMNGPLTMAPPDEGWHEMIVRVPVGCAPGNGG